MMIRVFLACVVLLAAGVLCYLLLHKTDKDRTIQQQAQRIQGLDRDAISRLLVLENMTLDRDLYKRAAIVVQDLVPAPEMTSHVATQIVVVKQEGHAQLRLRLSDDYTIDITFEVSQLEPVQEEIYLLGLAAELRMFRTHPGELDAR